MLPISDSILLLLRMPLVGAAMFCRVASLYGRFDVYCRAFGFGFGLRASCASGARLSHHLMLLGLKLSGLQRLVMSALSWCLRICRGFHANTEKHENVGMPA